MNDEHVNDELLQRYALNDTIPEDVVIHVTACLFCFSKIKQYAVLTKELQQLPKATFDFDRAALVPAGLKPKRHFPLFQLAMVSAIMIGFMLVTIGLVSLGHSDAVLSLAAVAVPILAVAVIFTILQHLRSWRLLSHI